MNQAFPIVNLNGTDGAELSEQCKTAWIAVQDAMKALQGMAPHGRDYQTAGPTSFVIARAQYEARMAALGKVKDEILEVYEGIESQHIERRKRTGL